MTRRAGVFACVFASLASAVDIATAVRASVDARNFGQAEAMIASYRHAAGNTPELIEAVSWLARGELAARNYDRAIAASDETLRLSAEALKSRPLDREPHLPLAVGAAVEVRALTLAAQGQRADAIAFLRAELKTYYASSIRARIQKNILLLDLEGKPAPALDAAHWIGTRPPTLAQERGRPVLLFFWAHWCPDCKADVPILARLAKTYAPRGLVLIGPTQHYGYVEGGEEASPAAETAYIEKIRREFYSALPQMPIPLSEENFRLYGASTTPTLVLIDRKGIVRMYHPGAMAYEDLESHVKAVI